LIQLNESQKQDCKNFILEVSNQYQALNTGMQRTPFLVRSETVDVIGVDGQLRPVSARTQLGVEGAIEFHLDSIRNYSPLQMLALLGHEFGHKVLFRGRFIEDNLPVENFQSGREFLDAIGQAIANFALESGFVGKYYGLGDQFDCRVQVRQDLPSMRMLGLTRRSFFNQYSFDRFESTIGIHPNDLFVEAVETWSTRIFLRATFHETNGCRFNESQGRWTQLELVRAKESDDRLPTSVDEVLVSQFYDHWNPLCEEKQTPLTIEYRQFKFTCRYLGTVADHLF
jgi:hypothetical protein